MFRGAIRTKLMYIRIITFNVHLHKPETEVTLAGLKQSLYSYGLGML